MITEAKARDLFIVDNSVSGWSALRYLEEWCSIAKAFDIATGYFEIGALLALDGRWQPLQKIRILMGAEMTYRTRKALLDAVRSRAAERLDASIEADKDANPFLHGVPAILDALRSRQIDCRVYDRDKFHAKAYITHAKLEVVGSQALVGSSNFSKPGLTTNIELNVQIQSAREVAQLQEWYEAHWTDASEITDAVIETISRHTHLYTPFDVYAKALQEFFRGHELTDTEWEETRSRMFHSIDRYQKEAYWALLKIARQHGGAFLCDGVGLGKTFVGLMLIERLVLHEGILQQARRIHQRSRAHRRVRDQGVRAMTIHQAKNREFDSVLVLWPYEVAGSAERQRRLLYNAITRAKRQALVVVQSPERLTRPPFVPDDGDVATRQNSEARSESGAVRKHR